TRGPSPGCGSSGGLVGFAQDAREGFLEVGFDRLAAEHRGTRRKQRAQHLVEPRRMLERDRDAPARGRTVFAEHVERARDPVRPAVDLDAEAPPGLPRAPHFIDGSEAADLTLHEDRDAVAQYLGLAQ